MTDLCVVGLGYIGLPTAALFAQAGLEVVGVDVDPKRLRTIQAGFSPIREPGLDEIIADTVARGTLCAVGHPVAAAAYIIAVPTPLGPDKTPDLSHVRAAIRAIAPVLRAGSLVVLESTVPVGTTAEIGDLLLELRADGPGAGIMVAHCPERVLPGRMLEELVHNDRVIGGIDAVSARTAADLYRHVVSGQCHLTDSRTAEMTKLSENAYRDVNIAFANELASIADANGIAPGEVIALANRHPRVSILDPGPGVGGHCIAVDPWFLASSAPGRAKLIRAARGVNDARPSAVARKALAAVSDLADPVIACFGLTYKRDVDDTRESPAVEVARLLRASGRGSVLAVEPHIDGLPAALDGVRKVTAAQALDAADLAVLLVDHTQFQTITADALSALRWIDTRGPWTAMYQSVHRSRTQRVDDQRVPVRQ